MAKGFLHGLLGDFVEGDAADFLPLFGIGAQLQRQVVGDRLTFAIRVRGQVNLVCLGGQLLQLVHHFLLARRHNQFRLKGPVLQLDANFVLRQIHDVPDRCAHLKTFAKILLDRLCLGGRFNDHQ